MEYPVWIYEPDPYECPPAGSPDVESYALEAKRRKDALTPFLDANGFDCDDDLEPNGALVDQDILFVDDGIGAPNSVTQRYSAAAAAAIRFLPRAMHRFRLLLPSRHHNSRRSVPSTRRHCSK